MKSKQDKALPPPSTVKRLILYLRYLNGLSTDGVELVSSNYLARKLDLNPAQVRKDLAYLGSFGRRGVGYSVDPLIEVITEALGTNRTRNVAILGAGGRLGAALAEYKGFYKRNFEIVALFDNNPDVIGRVVEGGGPIFDVKRLPELAREKEIEILIFAVPPDNIKELFKKVSEQTDVKAVLNFAPFKLISDGKICVHNVDLTNELEYLTYRMSLLPDC
ncbi:MAG: redox-sensing transcriptional repressor Rex [Candidatus Riflebacteria bacterium]|nr:redox-sensing transcriptional repressor Rex [Candidatus Riflebacteria bacterium]